MKKKKLSLGEITFQVSMIVLFMILFIACFYPFYYVFIASITDPSVPSSYIKFLPQEITLKNYKNVLELKGIGLAFFVSAARTVIGTFITLFMTSILAFCVTKRELPFRNFFYRFSVISMYISAGIIPWYLTMRSLGLKNNFLVYVLPSAVSAYCMILIKSYIESLPLSLQESALIDGAGYFTVYSRIVLPMSKPILAAVTVFTAVGQWNSWTDNLLLVSNSKLQTLQLILMQFLNQASGIAAKAQSGAIDGSTIEMTPFSVRMTITMVATIPILIVYPFVQKYFVKGIMLGAVKG